MVIADLFSGSNLTETKKALLDKIFQTKKNYTITSSRHSLVYIFTLLYQTFIYTTLVPTQVLVIDLALLRKKTTEFLPTEIW